MELEPELETLETVAEVEVTPAPVQEAPAEAVAAVEAVQEAPAEAVEAPAEAPKAKKAKEAPAPIQEVANPARIQVQPQGIVVARSSRNN